MAYGAPGAPGVVMTAPPPGMMLVPAIPLVDLMSALRGVPTVYINQKVELLEAITGCETKNRYHIHEWDKAAADAAQKAKAGKGRRLLKAKEDSSCMMRICCGPNRGYNMDIKGTGEAVAENPADQLFVERPFQCTCLFWCRPIWHVSHKTIGNIGEVYQPCRCCELLLEIRKPLDEAHPPAAAVAGTPDVWYRLRGSCCQLGLFCQCPCGPCKQVKFYLYRGDDEGLTEPVGEITKEWDSCIRQAFTDADSFSVVFPSDASDMAKALIVMSVISLDMAYFERKNQNQGVGGGGGGF